jgi:hypothetical protein
MLLTATYHQPSLGVVSEHHLTGFQSTKPSGFPSHPTPQAFAAKAQRVYLERMKADGQESIHPCVWWYGKNGTRHCS